MWWKPGAPGIPVTGMRVLRRHLSPGGIDAAFHFITLAVVRLTNNLQEQEAISITKKEFVSVFEKTLLCADLDITGLSLVDDNHVVITFKGSGKRKVNIEADSKSAIILDVMKHAF